MELEWEPRWLERTTTNLALWEVLAPCSHYAHSPHPRTMTSLPSGFQLFRVPSPCAALLFFLNLTDPEIEGLVANLTKNELFPWPGHPQIDWPDGSMAVDGTLA